jgi:hypothetical protein
MEDEYVKEMMGIILTKKKEIEDIKLNLIEHYKKKGFNLDNDEISEEAAKIGDLQLLKFVYVNGYHWDADTCSAAAKNGHLECLRYAHEHGCEWWVETCENAAEYGHLDCLIYAHEHGCPWEYSDDMCILAVSNGHLDCFKYLLKNGRSWNKEECIIVAIRNKKYNIVSYINTLL